MLMCMQANELHPREMRRKAQMQMRSGAPPYPPSQAPVKLGSPGVLRLPTRSIFDTLGGADTSDPTRR